MDTSMDTSVNESVEVSVEASCRCGSAGHRAGEEIAGRLSDWLTGMGLEGSVHKYLM